MMLIKEGFKNHSHQKAIHLLIIIIIQVIYYLSILFINASAFIIELTVVSYICNEWFKTSPMIAEGAVTLIWS